MGTPKADGTQECSCSENNVLKAEAWTIRMFSSNIREFGYNSEHGSLSPNTYKGYQISSFYTDYIGGSIKRKKIGTSLVFLESPSFSTDIHVRINNVVYTFDRVSSSSKTWRCKDRIFTSAGTYKIEFLN